MALQSMHGSGRSTRLRSLGNIVVEGLPSASQNSAWVSTDKPRIIMSEAVRTGPVLALCV